MSAGPRCCIGAPAGASKWDWWAPPPARQAAEYHAGTGEAQLLAEHPTLIDLRGRTSLIELAGACRAARAVVSNDNQGVGASPMRLWLPRAPQLQRTVSSASCDGCESRRYRNDACIAERHHCMEGVGPHQVIDWLAAQLG